MLAQPPIFRSSKLMCEVTDKQFCGQMRLTHHCMTNIVEITSEVGSEIVDLCFMAFYSNFNGISI